MSKTNQDSREITIKVKQLNDEINKLISLYNEVNNRQYTTYTLQKAKGAAVDEFAEASKSLKAIGAAFAQIVDKTRGILQETKDSFTSADNAKAADNASIGKGGRR